MHSILIPELWSSLPLVWPRDKRECKLLHETESRPITCIVCYQHHNFYGNVAGFKDVDLKLHSETASCKYRRMRSGPQNFWSRNVNVGCHKNVLGTGQFAAWRLTRRDACWMWRIECWNGLQSVCSQIWMIMIICVRHSLHLEEPILAFVCFILFFYHKWSCQTKNEQ